MINNLRKYILLYIYIHILTIVSTLQNFIPFVQPKRKGIPLVYLLLLSSLSLPHLFLFLSPYCQLDKTGKEEGELSRETGGGEDGGLCKPADYYLRATRRRANHLFIKWTIVAKSNGN